MKLWHWLLLALAVFGLAAVVADCSTGQGRFLECVVIARHYVPACYETRVGSDDDGNPVAKVIYHPEEFHGVFLAHGGDTLDLLVSRRQFYSLTNGQEVSVKVVIGRWSGLRYLPRLDEDFEAR